MTVGAVLLLVGGALGTWAVWKIVTAPRGHVGATGFHLGDEPEAFGDVPNVSALSHGRRNVRPPVKGHPQNAIKFPGGRR